MTAPGLFAVLYGLFTAYDLFDYWHYSICRFQFQDTFSSLAANIFASRYYLIRKFRNSVGMTPHQFCIQNRIRKSQRLLDEEKVIGKIAMEMGFYDQSHFDKAFKGVELKHIITAKDTDGKFSYHLVRIAPGCSIGNYVHETQLETHEVIKGSGKCVNAGNTIPYEPGTISIMQAGIWHEATAGSEGLYLFAKFIPALC